MFKNNSNNKTMYKSVLNQINTLSEHLKNDDDKIKLLSLINNLKYYASRIEPQESIDYYYGKRN